MSDKYDDMLITMLKECKTLPVFLDNIFGFLRRRTDFYQIAAEPVSSVGLPPGLAEQVVRHTFHKWKPDDIKVFPQDQIQHGKEEVVVDLTSESVRFNENKSCSNTAPDTTAKNEKEVIFTSSDCYNGNVFENYSWSQSIKDVELAIKIPSNARRKDLLVIILSDKLSVRLKDGTVLLEGELCQKCKHNEAIWSLENAKLEVHLDKCRQMWWDCLLKSEPKLDIQKLDCSRPYEDLPEEAQAKIEELQWNQERKRLGLPTSDQLSMQETLKKAWNAEGSPFSGPFDPNNVIIQ